MKKDKALLRAFDVPFSGLKLGEHEFEFEVKNEFFEYYGLQDYQDVEVLVQLILEKKSNMMILSFTHQGTFKAACDRCGDITNFSISSYEEPNRIYVKFGPEYINDQDDTITLEESAHTINVADLIYEFIALSIPAQLVHEEEEDCNQEVLDYLKNKTDNTTNDVDPRWEALKKLK